ncbi:hypothetical protein HPB47_014519 [Ixodes persulcatus]|uniref:Uncharacterized protein n=1 Tax=Ixodes persulcatus TaxID=34615 RepID=A0AC60QYC4_IXOPE|nr:hypothetical protein HPB47_014519 [Ixodes persulcatus]
MEGHKEAMYRRDRGKLGPPPAWLRPSLIKTLYLNPVPSGSGAEITPRSFDQRKIGDSLGGGKEAGVSRTSPVFDVEPVEPCVREKFATPLSEIIRTRSARTGSTGSVFRQHSVGVQIGTSGTSSFLMVTYCSVPQCTSRKAPGVSFHRYPKTSWLRKAWVFRLRTDKTPSTTAVVCSKHFQEQDFVYPVYKSDSVHEPSRASTRREAIARGIGETAA